jgi:hypothetical protein
VLAWNNGFWLDPLWKRFSAVKIPASSVPFFSEECGGTFRDVSEFDGALSAFSFTPRAYVTANLTMKGSAEIYTAKYFSLLAQP